jgi:hypothetical protein
MLLEAPCQMTRNPAVLMAKRPGTLIESWRAYTRATEGEGRGSANQEPRNSGGAPVVVC